MGKNETGKSNILRAIEFIAPDSPMVLQASDLSIGHDISELAKDLGAFIKTRWIPTEDEQRGFASFYARAGHISAINVSKRFDKQPSRWYGFEGIPAARAKVLDAHTALDLLVASLERSPKLHPFRTFITAISAAVGSSAVDSSAWGSALSSAIANINKL